MHPTSAGAGEQYHIRCKRGDLAKYLLVPGDPDRVMKIAEFWNESLEVACHREFRSFTGRYKGVPISAMSSGIGPAAMAILVNEAANVDVETFVRVESTGAIQKDIECGDHACMQQCVLSMQIGLPTSLSPALGKKTALEWRMRLLRS